MWLVKRVPVFVFLSNGSTSGFGKQSLSDNTSQNLGTAYKRKADKDTDRYFMKAALAAPSGPGRPLSLFEALKTASSELFQNVNSARVPTMLITKVFACLRLHYFTSAHRTWESR